MILRFRDCEVLWDYWTALYLKNWAVWKINLNLANTVDGEYNIISHKQSSKNILTRAYFYVVGRNENTYRCSAVAQYLHRSVGRNLSILGQSSLRSPRHYS